MSWKYCWSTIKMFFEQNSVLFQPKSAAGCAADWNPTWKSESKKLLCDSGNWTIKIIIRHCVTYNAMKIIISLVIIMLAFYYGCRCHSRRDWQGDKDLRHEETDSYCITSKVLIIIIIINVIDIIHTATIINVWDIRRRTPTTSPHKVLIVIFADIKGCFRI